MGDNITNIGMNIVQSILLLNKPKTIKADKNPPIIDKIPKIKNFILIPH